MYAALGNAMAAAPEENEALAATSACRPRRRHRHDRAGHDHPDALMHRLHQIRDRGGENGSACGHVCPSGARRRI